MTSLNLTFEPHDWDLPILTAVYDFSMLFAILNIPVYVFYLHVLHVNRHHGVLCNAVFDLFRAIGVCDLLVLLHHVFKAPLILTSFESYRAWLVHSGPVVGSSFFCLAIGSVISSFILLIGLNVNRLQSVLYPLKCKTWWSDSFTARFISVALIIPWPIALFGSYLRPLQFVYVYPNRTDEVTEMVLGPQQAGSVLYVTVVLGVFVCAMLFLYAMQMKALVKRIKSKKHDQVRWAASRSHRTGSHSHGHKTQIAEMQAAKGLLVAGSILLTPTVFSFVNFALYTLAPVWQTQILFMKFTLQNPYVLFVCSNAVRKAAIAQLNVIKLKTTQLISKIFSVMH